MSARLTREPEPQPRPAAPPPITLLTDYGPGSEYVGAMHAVIARLAPSVRVLDMAHDIPPFQIATAAATLRDVVGFAPAGIHVAVVDPGVGTDRRALAVSSAAEGRVFVGPDNGILTLAIAECGGATRAVEISRSRADLAEGAGPTFDGRDLFAPVAARIASGADLAECGEAIDAASISPLAIAEPEVAAGHLRATVTGVDRFGNIQLAATGADMERAGMVRGRLATVACGDREVEAIVASTFGDADPARAVVHCDSCGHVAVAVNRGSAAGLLHPEPGAWISIRAVQ